MSHATTETTGTRVGRALLLTAVLGLASGCAPAKPGPHAGRPSGTGSATASTAPVPAPSRRVIPATIAEALPHLANSAAAAQHIDFGNIAGATAVDGGTFASGPLAWVVGLGEGPIIDAGRLTRETTGINMVTIRSGVTAGAFPHQVTFLYGRFSTAAIIRKFKAAKYRQQPGTGASGTLLQARSFGGLSRLNTGNRLDVVDISPTRIVYGPSLADVTSAIASGSDTIATNPAVKAIADCLGRAKGATILPQGTGWGSSYPLGTGVAGTSPHTLTNVLCVSAPNAATASALAVALAAKIKKGTTRNPGYWRLVYSDPKATLVGGQAHIVRLTGHPVSPPGTPLQFEVPPGENGLAGLITS